MIKRSLGPVLANAKRSFLLIGPSTVPRSILSSRATERHWPSNQRPPATSAGAIFEVLIASLNTTENPTARWCSTWEPNGEKWGAWRFFLGRKGLEKSDS